jgi:hypothetical protein
LKRKVELTVEQWDIVMGLLESEMGLLESEIDKEEEDDSIITSVEELSEILQIIESSKTRSRK